MQVYEEGKENLETVGQRPASRIGRALRLGWTFILGHGAIQALSILTALYLVRRLSMADYAQYSLALAFQTTATSLTNLGLTDSIIPLVGARASDRRLVGGYVRSAMHLRNTLFLAIAPCCAALFIITANKHSWGWGSQLTLMVSILLSLHFSSSVSCYSAPLILHRRLYDYYASQVLPALGRLGACTLAGLTGYLGAGLASLAGAFSLLYSSFLTRRKATALIDLPTKSDKVTNREVLKCMLPMMPTAIFVSFQPQLALFLISAFGETKQIAEVSALSKIGQVFLIFNTFNTMVLEPYVARTAASRLAAVYTRVIMCSLTLAFLLSAFAYRFPWALTALIGAKYKGLNDVVAWVVLGSSVSIVSNAIWVMNRARKWIFWRGSVIEISSITLSQIAFVLLVGVHTTRSAAILSLVASLASLATQTYIAFFGFTSHRYSQGEAA